MECPLCGELCTCAADRSSSSARGAEANPSHVAVLIDPESPESSEASEQSFAASLAAPPAPEASGSVTEVPLNELEAAAREAAAEETVLELDEESSQPVAAVSAPAVPAAPFYRPEESSAWRQEVSSRVDSYRTRRRRYDPNSSLSLNFEDDYEAAAQPEAEALPSEAPKVIEFPKPTAAPSTPVLEELAEPVVEKPRILEAEEPAEEEELAAPVAAPPIASVTLEPPMVEPAASAAPPEILLWLAPPATRIFAGLVDALIVALATGLFGLIFLQMNDAAPSGRLALGFALVVPGLFWALYQYLFLVYGGTTPGLQVAGLRLTTFDGDAVPRRLRRWRALAMMVSYVSLGLGFLWAMVDEDGLCWHDRITRTCVRE
jgi:uncharacterized RDD family membrane protein YckC